MIPAIAPKMIDRLLLLAVYDPKRVLDHPSITESSSNPYLFAWRQYCLGLANLRLQRLEALGTALEYAQQAFARLNDQIGLLHCQGLTLAGAWLEGTNVENLIKLEQLTKNYLVFDCKLEAARTQMLHVLHYYSLGKAEQALPLMQASAPVIQQFGREQDQAFWLWISGIVYTHSDDFHQAGVALDRALELFTKLHMHPDISRCLFDRSWLFQRQERYHEALNDLAQAQTIANDLKLRYLVAACYKNRGMGLSRLGRYAAAIDLTLMARHLYVQLAREDLINGCDLNLANIAFYGGLYELALKLFQRVETTYRRLNLMRMVTASLRNQALVLRAQHQSQAAYDLLRSIEATILQGNDQLEQAEYWQALAFALAELDDLNQAVAMFTHSEGLFRELDNQPAAAKCRLELAWLALRGLQQTQQADPAQLTEIKQSLQATLDYLNDRPFYRWRILYGIGLCEAKLGQFEAALNAYIQASITITSSRLEFSEEHASSAVFAQAHDLFIDALGLALQINDAVALLILSEQQRALVLRQYLERHERSSTHSNHQIPRALQAQLWRILGKNTIELVDKFPQPSQSNGPSAKFESIDQFNGFNLAGLRQLLTNRHPNGWAIISYICHDASLIRLIVTKTDLQVSAIPFDATLDKLIRWASLTRYRWSTYSGIQATSEQAWPALDLLSAKLLPPGLADQFNPLMSLFIVPAERLHGIAWGALRLDQRWLCQQATINIIPNLSQVKANISLNKPHSPGVIIACSQFANGSRPLPNVVPEIAKIKSIYAQAAPLIMYNSEVTKARINELSNAGSLVDRGFLHIASHAHMRPGGNGIAYIQLWDDILTFDEILDLQLHGTLVLLSVCDGSASQVLVGEEVLSLSRAFLAAGAPAVIANLWKHHDDSSPQLMAQLHRLLSNGISPAIALTRLQNKWIMQSEQSTPLIWGGFQILSTL